MNYNKGLFLDSRPIDQPEGTYRYLLNGMINRELGAVCNELGSLYVAELDSLSTTVIGHLYVSDSEIYLFCVNSSNFSSLVCLRSSSTGRALTTILDDSDFSTPLGFKASHTISATYNYNSNQELLIYWTDGLNTPRYYNVTEPQELVDINSISLFTIFNTLPDIQIVDINNVGGSLKTGSYQLGFSFSDKDFNESNVIVRDTVVLITDDNTKVSTNDGFVAGVRTSKSIDISVSNVDSVYKYMNLYVVRYESGVYAASYKISSIVLNASGVTKYTLNGSETEETASLESILINKVFYDKIKTLTQIDGVLYGGNVVKRSDLGYQKYANNIKLRAVTKRGHDLTNAGERVNALDETFMLRGSFQRDEVYAFYISFLLKDGSESYAYHIPGRAAEESVAVDPDVNRVINIKSNLVATSYPLNSDALVFNPDYFVSGFPFADDVDFELVVPSSDVDFSEYLIVTTYVGMAVNSFLDALVIKFKATKAARNGEVDLLVQYETDVQNASIRMVALKAEGLGAYIRSGINEYGFATNVYTRQDGEMVYNSPSLTEYRTTPIALETIIKLKLERTQISNNAVTYAYTTKTNGVAKLGKAVADTTEDLYDFIVADADFSTFTKTRNTSTGYNYIDVNNDTYYYRLIIELHSNTYFNFFEVNNAQTINPYLGDENALLNDSADIYCSEFIDSVDGLKNFHVKSSNSQTYNTAYWENENEMYPDNSNWDIFDVVDGEGVDTEVTLRNTNVRHHKFSGVEYLPYSDYDTDTSGVKNSDEYAVYLGIELSDIKIPDDIKEKVIGYKVYYAKRTQNNSTVLGQGFCFSAAKNEYGDALDIQKILKPNAWYDSYKYFTATGDLTDAENKEQLSEKVFQFYDFNLLRTRANISAASYVKINKFFPIDYFTRTSITGHEGNRHVSYQIGKETSKFTPIPEVEYNGENYSQVIRRLQAVSYIDNRAELTKTSALGFSYDYYNKWSESKVLFETKNLPLDTQGGYIATLKAFKTDCYVDFDNQQLVCCYSSSDLDSTTTEQIFAGDVHINGFAFKAVDCLADNDDLADFDRIGFYRIVTECKDNLAARYEGTEYNEVYYPKTDIEGVAILDVSASDYINKETDTRGIGIDNWYGYSIDAHKRAELKSTIPFPKLLEENVNLFNRVIRSQKNNFRTFLENDYKDLPLHRGQIINLEEHSGNLLIHTEKSLFTTRGREELSVADFRAFIGSGDIFAVEPKELYTSNEGYGGIKEKLSANKNKFGYFFVSLDEQKIFWLSDNINEINTIGLTNYFRENLIYPKIIKTHSPLTYLSYEELALIQNCQVVRTGFDPVYNRFFVTLQYKNPTSAYNVLALAGNTSYSNGKIYNNLNVEITNNGTYFTTVETTLSFLPEYKVWDSFHSYHPKYIISGRNEALAVGRSTNFNSIFQLNKGVSNSFLGDDTNTFEFTIVQTEEEIGQAVGLLYLVDFLDADGNKPAESDLKYANFNQFRVKNGLQDTGLVDIVYFTLPNGNSRYKLNQWAISGIREPNEDWTKRRKLRDRFFEITLKTDFSFNGNYENYSLYLYNILLLTR